jgi:hypothetical protein
LAVLDNSGLDIRSVELTPAVASRWTELSEIAQSAGQTQIAKDALRRVRELQQTQFGQ